MSDTADNLAVPDAEKRAYSRGYNAARKKSWPAHRPPLPPHEVVANLMSALQQLRDAVDNGCATFDATDPFVVALDPAITIADAAMEKVTEWLDKEQT